MLFSTCNQKIECRFFIIFHHLMAIETVGFVSIINLKTFDFLLSMEKFEILAIQSGVNRLPEVTLTLHGLDSAYCSSGLSST